MNDRELVIKALTQASEVVSPQASNDLAEDILWNRLCGLGYPQDSIRAKETLKDLFRGLDGHSLAWKICHVAENAIKTNSVERRPGRKPDPELKALAETLPRRPGYVSFVRDVKYLATHKRIMKEQGVVVFTRPDKKGDMTLPLFCAFQSLKSHRNMEGMAPRWFVPAGKGLALLRVVPTEYREMPLESNISIFDAVTRAASAQVASMEDRMFERAVQKCDPFPFEVGDWVYVDQTYLDNEGKPVTFTVKAQIEQTRNTDDPTYCDLKLEPGVHKTPTLCLEIRPNHVVPHEKSLITQRAFPPIPYSSKREIGTSDVPGGYLNLDWE